MTFENYWAENGVTTTPAVLGLALREIAEKAWNAATRAEEDATSAARKQIYDPSVLTRCVLSGEALEQFKREARMHILNNPEMGFQARIYTAGDGRFLIDSIDFPGDPARSNKQ